MNKKYSVDEAILQMLKWKNIIILIGTMIVFMAAGFILKGHQNVSVEEQAFTKIQVNQLDGQKHKEVVIMYPSDVMFVNTYMDNLRTDRVVKQVKAKVAKVGYKLTKSEIKDMTKVEMVGQTSIIKIQTTGDKIKEVKAVDKAYRQLAVKEFDQTMDHGQAKVVDSGTKTESTSLGMSRKKVLFFSGILGFVLAFVVVFFKYYFDQKIRSRRYLAQRLDMTVLNQASSDLDIEVAATNVALVAPKNGQVGILYDREMTADGVQALAATVKALGGQAAELTLVPVPMNAGAAWLTLDQMDAYVVTVLNNKTTKDFVLDVLSRDQLVKAQLLGAVYFDKLPR